jgi:effector-binding domain-containing protein
METTKYEVREIKWPERNFLAKRATIAFDNLPAFFGESYGAMYGLIQERKLHPIGVPSAIYYSIDEQKKETDLAAAVPIEDGDAEIKEFQKITIPSSQVVTTTHYGSYENMHPAYRALEDYLIDHRLKKDLIVEEYYSDPEKEKDPSKWKTNIYFVVRKIS